GLRASVPLKITSANSPPPSALADCSASTRRIASATLDLPQPFEPTIAVTPGRNFREILSAKDLHPKTVKFLRYIAVYRIKPAQICKVETRNIWAECSPPAQLIGEEPRFASCAKIHCLPAPSLPLTALVFTLKNRACNSFFRNWQ